MALIKEVLTNTRGLHCFTWTKERGFHHTDGLAVLDFSQILAESSPLVLEEYYGHYYAIDENIETSGRESPFVAMLTSVPDAPKALAIAHNAIGDDLGSVRLNNIK